MTITQEVPEPLLYTVEEAGFLLSLSGGSIRKFIRTGELKTIRPTPLSIRISRQELEQFVRTHRAREDNK